ncbi:MAG TPA: hypothetical protein PLW48_03790 [Alphaproteobacteria bacterium]|nr:hypothetical protein [Rhodospirillaceae bacterium]HRJ66234.1 hypothetical protein [Alphaproteobacteria bacterium]
MTTEPVLPENDRRIRHEVTADEGQSTFTFDFPVEGEDDLVAYVDDDEAAIASVDLQASEVVLDVPAEKFAIVVVEGRTSLSRRQIYPVRGGLPSARLNTEINQLFFALQEQRRDSGRQIEISKSVGGDFDRILPTVVAGRALMINDTGNGFAMGPTASEIASAAPNAAAAIAAKEAAENARDQAVAAAAALPENNWTATTDPTVNDDETEGWVRGSKWLNTLTSEVYLCASAATGAAVWLLATLDAGDLGSMAMEDAADYQPIDPRVQTVASAATVTPTNENDLVTITAQAEALTLANPTGTMVQGQALIVRVKDNGTARAIGYGTNYRALGVTLPTTTVLGKTLYLAMIWNATDTKFDVTGVAQEA